MTKATYAIELNPNGSYYILITAGGETSTVGTSKDGIFVEFTQFTKEEAEKWIEDNWEKCKKVNGWC